MKKGTLMLSAIFCIQLVCAQHPHFGLKVGVNISNLKFKGFDASEYKAGINAGILAHIHLNKEFALQPELFYSMQGGKDKLGTTEYKTSLNYINLPLLFPYMFGNGFRIQAGPQLGFLVSAKQKINSVEYDVKDNYKTVDVGLPVGMSYVGQTGWGADIRWVFGLSDINDAAAGVKTYNNGAQLGIFYIFGVAHKTKKK